MDRGGKPCEEWRRFRADLLEHAAEAPQDRFVMGQVVYALVRSRAYEDALATLEGCRTDPWWCEVLRAHVLAERGDVSEAEAAFDGALQSMPLRERCEWGDLWLVVSSTAHSEYGGSTCRQRLLRLERFWWLADPSWEAPFNDRRVEHYNRMAWAALHDDDLTGASGDGRVNDGVGHSRDHHRTVVRFGMDYVRADGRWHEPPDRQRYRVLPEDDALLTPFHATRDAWPLVPDGEPSNYMPSLGTLHPLDVQVAFFERGDSLLAAAAARVPDEAPFGGIPDPEAVLFLHPGPPQEPVTVRTAARDGRWLLEARAPRRRYVVGVESLATGGLSRARLGHGLPHEPPQPLRLSDILLFTPETGALPDSLDAALKGMKAGSTWRQGETLGVFFEVHAPADRRSSRLAVTLERRQGWLGRLAGLLGLGGSRPVALDWAQTLSGQRSSVSFTLDPGNADEGAYTLRVSLEMSGMSPVAVEKNLRIVPGGSP